MRAAVVHEHGPIDNIIIHTDVAEPEPPPGWVRLKVAACSVNYHDIFSRRGMPGITLPLPLIIGSDIAGVVDALGPGVREKSVDGVDIGARVLVDPMPNADNGGRMVGERFDGGRAEYCVVPATQLIDIPDGVSDAAAASIPLAYATAHRMMVTRGRVGPADTVLVLGASGGVGTACVLLAKQAGATVIACASSAEKLDRLSELGADHQVNYQHYDMREAVWDLVGKPRITGTGGVDLVINSTGGGTWHDSIRCMKVGARLVTCGATAGFDEQIDVRYVWTYEHDLMGSNGWRRSDIEAMLSHAARGTLTPVIDRVLPLEEAREADRLLEAREVIGKVVLVP
jgi:alcohol dehydrogenase